MNHSHLHYTIINYLLDRGFPPSIAELAAHFGKPIDAVRAALRALEEYHGVVLHPKSGEVWVIHPFSAAPTPFWVESARGRWWGNCAWCSLGIAGLVGGDVSITATLGGESERAVVRIENGKVVDPGLVVHFPIPMARAWDNVAYTCSTMLLFRSEAAVADWCARHRIPKGDVRPIQTVWEFARVWYGRHLDRDWTKWTAAEAAELF